MSVPRLRMEGVFVDLDGTIIDSKEAYSEAARVAFQHVGHNLEKLLVAMEIPRRIEQGMPLDDIVGDETEEFLRVYLNAYYSIAKTRTHPFAYVGETLQELSKRTKLALITMRRMPKEDIIEELDRFGLAQFFSYITTALDVHKPKPSPDALVEAMRTLKVEVRNCLIVGDSVMDIRAGKAAGIKTAAVLTGLFKLEELAKEQPDYILKDFSQLLKIIA